MPKIQDLFASSGMLLLAAGMVASRLKPLAGLTVQTGSQSRGFALGFETPLYFVATLFGLFAFLYSIGYIPFSPAMPRWHFSLSALSVLTCTLCAVLFRLYLPRLADGKIGLAGQSVAISFVGCTLIFVCVQTWFAVDLVRAVLKMGRL